MERTEGKGKLQGSAKDQERLKKTSLRDLARLPGKEKKRLRGGSYFER